MPSEDPVRVNRGGSWYYAPANARVALRFRLAPDFRYDDLGVRLIRLTGVLEQIAEAKDVKQ